MVEEILQWLKNISIFLIFMTTVLNLIPEKEDKKPVQFFLGIVMVLIFFQPVLKAGGLEQKMAQTLDRLTLEEEAAAMENVQIRAESFEKQYYVGAWGKRDGAPDPDVSVRERHSGGSRFGNAGAGKHR